MLLKNLGCSQYNTAMNQSIAKDLCDYIAKSPTPFHATRTLLELFTGNGFKHLGEADDWTIESNSSYVITRNDSSIIAFRTGKDYQQGFQMLGAHTDSPCLRIKPNPVATPNLVSRSTVVYFCTLG